MALADGKPGYTPPARIQQMRRELWWLPQWWAEEDDIVWDGEAHLDLPDDTTILPWGWSPSLCHQLQRAGVKASLLPSPEKLEHIRQLSHRQTAVSLLQELRDELPLDGHLAGRSVLCRSIEEAEAAANTFGLALLKSPWSSSGRGLMQSDKAGWKAWGRPHPGGTGKCRRGAVTAQADRLCPEFWLDGHGGVEYRGLSLFYTNERGAYLGNWVAPEGQKLAWLAQYVPCNICRRYAAGGKSG